MAIGKYLSLREAQKKPELLERFAKEHKSNGDRKQFRDLLGSIVRSSESDDQTSSDPERSED